jgi:hypothetical protein
MKAPSQQMILFEKSWSKSRTPFGSIEAMTLDLTRRVLCIDANPRKWQGTTI